MALMKSQIRKFPPEKLAKYPHMFPADIEIWERFLERYGQYYKAFAYDVKVGVGRKPLPHWEPEIQRMYLTLTKKRIDAVGFQNEFVDIIEVKPNAGPSAVGQVITYKLLFEREYSTTKEVRAMIVTDREVPDMNELAGRLGFIYVIV